MYRKIIGMFLWFFAAVICGQNVFAQDNVQLKMVVSAQKESVNCGDVFTVDFNIIQNTGFNSFTFFVDYDPSIIVPLVIDENDSDDDRMAFSGSSILTVETVNNQINVVPSADDLDFEGLGADGIKTAAQLGRVKLSAIIYNSGKPGTTNETGKLFSMKFKVADNAEGFTDIKITPVNSGFAPILSKTEGELTTSFTSALISVTNEAVVGDGNVVYVVEPETGKIISVNTAEKIINVPSVISGTAVMSIGENAFENCTNAESIILPSGVTQIGKYAFSGCNLLREISIPKTTAVIDDYAFQGCEKLLSVTLPYRVRLGIGTFSGCSLLEKVSFE